MSSESKESQTDELNPWNELFSRIRNIEDALVQLNTNLSLLIGEPEGEEGEEINDDDSLSTTTDTFDTKKCWHEEEMPDHTLVQCPLPQVVDQRYCVSHMPDYLEFMNELELYVLEKLGTPDREKSKALGVGWKGALIQDLGIGATKIGKVVKENAGKTAKEIAKILDNMSIEL